MTSFRLIPCRSTGVWTSARQSRRRTYGRASGTTALTLPIQRMHSARAAIAGMLLNILAENVARGVDTIIVGGTGLYVKALTDGLTAAGAGDPAVRAYWSQVCEQRGIGGLQEALREKNPAVYEGMPDKQNARRLIRALELADSAVAPAPRTWHEQEDQQVPLVGLAWSVSDLNRRIEARVDDMYRAGLVDEVRKLLAEHGELSPTARHAIGYAEAIDILAGRCSTKAAIERTVLRTRQLAKKQRTWFRHQADVRWIEVEARHGGAGDRETGAGPLGEIWPGTDRLA